jgi:hypothetical protein
VIPDSEAAIQRQNTRAFIAADAELVALVPRVKETTASNGVVYRDLPPLPSQVMRLIPSTSNRAVERQTLDGTLVFPEYTLLGEYNAQMERGYRFVLEGNRYEIVMVNEKRDYETKAEVVRIGSA